MRKANVMLMRTEQRAEATPPALTSTDAEGKFAMKNIEPGQYRLSASKPGFVNSDFGARAPGGQPVTLTLEKGQSMKELELKLTPHSVITGRITDEDGDPVQYARVALMRYRYFQGRKQLMPGGVGQTNDLGEYRLFGVGPGRYYVSADAARMGYGYGVDRSAVRQTEETNASTYYPNAPDVQSAVQINVPLAGVVQGIDVRLRKEKAFRVSGKVSGVSQGPGGGMVMLVKKDGGGGDMMGFERNAASWRAPSGDFEIKGVRPGSYVVRANYYEPDKQLSGSASIEVTDSDVEGVSVLLGPGVEISGSVSAEGEAPPKMNGITLYLESRISRFVMGGAMGRVKEDGAFQVQKVAADHYDLRVNGVPPEYYVKSVRLADTDVKEHGLDLSSGGSAAGVEIVLGADAAQLEGTVADEKGNALRGASVVLRPTSGKAWDLAMTRPVSSDQNGRFQIKGIRPGEYKLIAFTGAEPGEEMDPDFFKEYENKAETVKLDPRSTETRQLKAVAAGAR